MSIEHLVFHQGPKRVGPFSHAVKAGGFLFVTGQMPTLPNDPTKLIEGDIISQTHQVMKNLKLVLTAANTSLEDVVFVRIYLINFQDFEKMNGFPNFWGWGFEDNAMNARCKQNKITIDRDNWYKYQSKHILHSTNST